MRAAILARVSTSEQAGERHSLPVQRQMMSDYAVREGFEVVATFEIPGESAYTDDVTKRPQFVAAITAAERGDFDVMLVYDLSRFARDQYVLHDSLRRLRKANVQLVGVAMGVEYTTNPMLAGMEGIFAEASSREHSRRVRHAYSRRHDLGLPTGDIPFGYRSGSGPLAAPVVEPSEAEAVVALFRDYVAGAGYSELASRLNSLGLTPRSKRGRTVFSHSAVQSILENDFYAGFVHHGESRRLGLHESIITEDLWLAAQARPKRIHRVTRQRRMLSSMVACYHCGGPVWLSKSGRAGKVDCYKEAARARNERCDQAGRTWPAEDAEQRITAAIQSMAFDSEWLAAAERIAIMPATTSTTERRASLLEDKRRLAEVYLARDIEEAEYRQRRQAIDLQIASLPVEQPMTAIGPRLERIGQVWSVMSIDGQREALQTMFEWVRLDWESREVRLQPWPEFQAAFAHRRDWCADYTPERTRTAGQHIAIGAAELVA